MTENRHRARAERGEVQIGTSDVAVLRSAYAAVTAEIRRLPRAVAARRRGPTRAEARTRPRTVAQEPSGRRYGIGTYSTEGRVRVGCGNSRMSSYTSVGISVVTGRPSALASSEVMA